MSTWLGETTECLSLTSVTSGGVALTDYFLESQAAGPPYTRLEIDLAGPDRLCLEANRIASLDLNPVRTTLKDMRGAIQFYPDSASHGLTFTTLTGSLPQVWHYCVRDQPVSNIVPHSQLPAVEQYWVWNSGQTSTDAPTSSVLTSFRAQDNSYDQASVDTILVALDTLGADNGLVDLSGSAAPSSTGTAAAASLAARGWTVTTA